MDLKIEKNVPMLVLSLQNLNIASDMPTEAPNDCDISQPVKIAYRLAMCYHSKIRRDMKVLVLTRVAR